MKSSELNSHSRLGNGQGPYGTKLLNWRRANTRRKKKRKKKKKKERKKHFYFQLAVKWTAVSICSDLFWFRTVENFKPCQRGAPSSYYYYYDHHRYSVWFNVARELCLLHSRKLHERKKSSKSTRRNFNRRSTWWKKRSTTKMAATLRTV